MNNQTVLSETYRNSWLNTVSLCDCRDGVTTVAMVTADAERVGPELPHKPWLCGAKIAGETNISRRAA
jgi:hypothetical protein